MTVDGTIIGLSALHVEAQEQRCSCVLLHLLLSPKIRV
jgi:hypothetical protein